MCNAMFPEPFMNCCFIDNNTLFVACFHNYTRTHYHFIYSLEHNNIVGKYAKLQLDCTKTNFTYKAFYNSDLSECYLFYR